MADRCPRCRGRGEIRPIGLGPNITCPDCGGSGDKKRKPQTQTPRAISPAAPVQRAKVNGDVCRGCGKPASQYRTIDPAHVVDRGAGGCDDPLCCVPLCRKADGSGCHRDYDDGKLDLLPRLAFDEQAHAAGHLGLLGALRRTTGDRYEPVRSAAA